MKKTHSHTHYTSKDIKSLPLYKKALDIFKLNRSLAVASSNSSDAHELYISTCPIHKRLSNLISLGIDLVKNIAMAETVQDRLTRAIHVSDVERCIYAIESDYAFLNKTAFRKDLRLKGVLKSEIKILKTLLLSWKA